MACTSLALMAFMSKASFQASAPMASNWTVA